MHKVEASAHKYQESQLQNDIMELLKTTEVGKGGNNAKGKVQPMQPGKAQSRGSNKSINAPEE